jgi:hypothetical protein
MSDLSESTAARCANISPMQTQEAELEALRFFKNSTTYRLPATDALMHVLQRHFLPRIGVRLAGKCYSARAANGV